jgi:hypothetical protein
MSLHPGDPGPRRRLQLTAPGRLRAWRLDPGRTRDTVVSMGHIRSLVPLALATLAAA